MGGKLFYGSVPLNVAEYEAFITNIRASYPDYTFDTIPAYNDKSVFNDVDLIVSSATYSLEDFVSVYPNIKSLQAEKAPDYAAFLTMDNVHLDIFWANNPTDIESYYFCYRFMPLTDLLRPLYYQLDLYLDQYGLREFGGNKTIIEPCNTLMSQESALNLVGLSYLDDFDTQEDIFNYVKSSPMFDADFYDLRRLPYLLKNRMVRRPDVQLFLEGLNS